MWILTIIMFLKYFPPFCKLAFWWTFLLLWRSFSVWYCLTCLFLSLLHVLLVSYPKEHCQDQYPYVQVGFRKDRRTRDQIPNTCWVIKKAKEFQKNIYFCFIDYAKAFHHVDHNKLGRFFKRWEHQTTLPASWEICMQVKRQQLEMDIEQQTGSKLGREYIKAMYCHTAYLTFMQSTSCELPGWMKHKLESRLPGEI